MSKKAAFGAIVGRYQTPYLHDGHKSTIDKVLEQHENIVILLGVQKGQPSERCPMDFQTRKVMILEAYPDATVIPLPDQKSDHDWSNTLDERLGEVIGMNGCVLYGSRDSFIPHYHGRFETKELESPDTFISATALRDEVIRKVKNSQDFRAGIIYGVSKRFPSPYITVDLAITKAGKLLLVQKPYETGWRFLGGFVDNTDLSITAAAKREAGEEVGRNMELSGLMYVTDTRIDDWRYRATKEKIFSVLYTAECMWGEPEPNDDIKFAKWVAFEDLHKEEIEPEHIPLMKAFLDYMNTYLNKQAH